MARTMEPIPELELSWSAETAAAGVWFNAPLAPRPSGKYSDKMRELQTNNQSIIIQLSTEGY